MVKLSQMYIKKKTMYTCSYCDQNVNITQYYIFKVVGLGKHNHKYICKKCLENELIKSIN